MSNIPEEVLKYDSSFYKPVQHLKASIERFYDVRIGKKLTQKQLEKEVIRALRSKRD